MKKLLITTCAATSIFAFSLNADAKTYKDIKPNNFYYDQVDEATDLKIMGGYTDGTFKPKTSASRSTIAVSLVKAMNKAKVPIKKKSSRVKLRDVKSSDAKKPYIQKVQQAGLMSAKNSKFNPSGTMTKNQALALILKSFSVKPKVSYTYMPFKDVNSKSKNYKNVLRAYQAGIITPDFTRNFNGKKPIKREELADMLNKAVKYQETKSLPLEKSIFNRKDYSQPPANVKYKNTYKNIYNALSKSEPIAKFDLNEVSYLDISKIIKEDFVHATGDKFMIKSWTASSLGTITIKYNDVKTKNNARMASTENASETVVKKVIKPTYTDMEKVKALHDYLVLTGQYDTINYNKGSIPFQSYSAYGALLNRVMVCDGYTKAMTLMLNKIGIKNYYAYGYANGDSHSWNMVVIKGKNYHVDSTWDDPIPNKKNQVLYKYFLISDKQISKDHKISPDSLIPKATSTRFDSK